MRIFLSSVLSCIVFSAVVWVQFFFPQGKTYKSLSLLLEEFIAALLFSLVLEGDFHNS